MRKAQRPPFPEGAAMTNPELKRNLWLQFSPHRLIAMPVLLGLLFLAGAASSREALAAMVTPSFVLIVWLWGTRHVSASIVDELRDKTWDQQRMSALQPWTMTWGKLAGASSFAWYGGAICLAVGIATALSMKDGSLAATLRHSVILVAVAVMLHASAMTVNLHASKVETAVIQRGGAAWVVVILGLAIFPWTYAEQPKTVHWWALTVRHDDFLLGSCLFFACCAVFASWRVMCNALQVRTLPWAWPLFTILLTIYGAGLYPDAANIIFFYVGAAIAALLTYAAAFSEPNGIPLWQRVLLRFRQGDMRGMLEHLPIFTTSLALLFVFAVIGTLLGVPRQDSLQFPIVQNGVLIAIAFAVLRDIFVLLFFSFSKNPKRVEATTVLYLVVIYGLLPFLAKTLELDSLRYLLLPIEPVHGLHASLIMAGHAALAFGLVVWRWRWHTSQSA
jgi:hypothetical protein